MGRGFSISEKDRGESRSAARKPQLEDVLTANAVDLLPAGRLQEQLKTGKPLRIKLGIDPTAPDIHLGHAVVLGKLADFQSAGHTVVLIIGDFTARVGDPSGRSSQRPVLSEQEIKANAQTFTEQAFKILDPDKTEVRFNSEWLEMDTSQMLALLSSTTVSQLLERKDFQNRWQAGQPISMLEMIYPLLQGYDSVAVNADVEVGGTDQKFNLLLAREIQAEHGMNSQSILTMPVLPGTDGQQKMSKALKNYIAVSDSAEEIFGKTMSIPDHVMSEYYRLLLGEVEPDIAPNLAKRQLAAALTTRFHDQASAQAAEAAFDRLHVDKLPPKDISEVSINSGRIHLPELLSEQFGFSKGEARRRIKQGGVKVNGQKVSADTLDVDTKLLEDSILQAGKRQFVQVRVR